MTNAIKKIALLTLCIALIYGCGSFEKATTLNPSTNYFPAKKIKQPTTLKEIEVSRDSLRTFLLVVPSTDYFLQMGKNLNYFDTVMTYDQLQTAIVKEGLSDKVPSLSDKVGLKRAYDHYRKFVLLEPTKVQKPGDGWFAGLALYEPQRAEVIFQNEIWLNLMLDGWTDQGTMFPLFNSMLDYLREEKK
jgi:hypothetical protein